MTVDANAPTYGRASRALIVAQIKRLTARLASEDMQAAAERSPHLPAVLVESFEEIHRELAAADQSLLLFDAAFRYGLAEARDYATADVIAAATYRDYQRADDGTRAAIARTEQRRQVKDRRAFQTARNAHV